MNHAHLVHCSRRAVVLIALLLPFGTGCSEAFKECVDEWNECTAQCPNEEEAFEIEDAATAAVLDCYEGCPNIVVGVCYLVCYQEFLKAMAVLDCSDDCDAAFAECVDALPVPASPPPQLARQLASGRYEIDRSALAGLLSSPLTALQGATYAPLSLDGGTGFVLLSVEPNAVIAQLGGKAGDVLARIGNEPVTEASWQAGMRSLLTQGSASVTIVRAGASLRLTYTLR